MDPPVSSATQVRFGPFAFNSRTGELRKHGIRVRLPEQSCKVLVALLERPGELVTRDELRERLWPAGVFVDFEHGLNLAVTRLRQALGDGAERPRYVETLLRKGYRFIAGVEPVTAQPLVELAPVAPDRNFAAAASERRHKSSGLLRWEWSLPVIAVIIGILLVWWQRASHKPALFSAVPLTSYAGPQLCPSFAPDGMRVAFSWEGEAQDNYDIYVKQIGAAAPVRLTSNPAPDIGPAWSPDGRSIAFVRLSSASTAELLLKPSLVGGEERRIAKLSAPYRGYEDLRLLAWSADGKWIVAPDCAKTGSTVGLFLISVESGEKRRLTLPSTAYDDLDPIFAPDMKRLAFVRHSGDPAGDLYFLELTGDVRPNGMPKRLTFDHRRTSSPVWTGDGSALLFSRYSMPGSHSLWKIALSNPGRPEPLPISADNAFALAISPDGNRLVYTRETNNTNIWAVELPASQPDKNAGVPKLFIASSRQESTPSFSPDGQQIAFQSSRSGWQEIWVADRDGSHSHQMTELKGSAAGFPRWSPDGKKIVFHSRQQSYAQLVLIDLASRRVSRPRYEAVDEFMPSWSHDGKRIYFASRRSGDIQVWQIPAAGGPATQLTKNGGWAPLESADGMFLFYTKPNAVGLWTMPVSGGGERQLLPDSVCAIGSAYAVGRKGIYFIQQANRRDRGMLAFLSLVTGQVTALAELPRPIELGLTISPDETLLLYSQVDQVSSDLMLVENFR